MNGQMQYSRSFFPCSILTAERSCNADDRSRAVFRTDRGSIITILLKQSPVFWGSDQWNKRLSLSLFFSNLKEECYWMGKQVSFDFLKKDISRLLLYLIFMPCIHIAYIKTLKNQKSFMICLPLTLIELEKKNNWKQYLGASINKVFIKTLGC